MTAFDRFERSIPELMTELAPLGAPDYVDDLLQRTAATRQRPAWSALERWIPMADLTGRLATAPRVPWRQVATALLIIALLAVAAAAIVGSRAPSLPPPFGVAGNGVLLYRGADGQILSLDPKDGSTRTVATAAGQQGDPVPSRDGRRIALVPFYQEASAPIVVIGIDGRVQASLGDFREIDAVDWSPDGSEVAIVSNVDGLQSITVASSDGSGARTLPIGRQIAQIVHLPDGRIAFVAAERPGDECPGNDPTRAPCALFVVQPDGTGLETLIPASTFHGINVIDPSADGTKLLWVEWRIGAGTTASPEAPGRLHLFDLRTNTDQRLPDDAIPSPYNINRAWLSPDGTAILFDYFEAESTHWAVVPTAGGAPVRIGQDIPADGTDAMWAPDGRSVLARYPQTDGTSQLWLLDPSGGPDRRLDADLPSFPAWQRVASGG
jgi:Tol biopolymer transport system component